MLYSNASYFTTKDVNLFNNPEQYNRLVGKLNYLIVTRLDFTYSISVANQFVFPHNTSEAALEQILCYIKGAPGCDLLYSNHDIIKCFSNEIGLFQR